MNAAKPKRGHHRRTRSSMPDELNQLAFAMNPQADLMQPIPEVLEEQKTNVQSVPSHQHSSGYSRKDPLPETRAPVARWVGKEAQPSQQGPVKKVRTTQEVQGIGHLKQLSKYGSHMRHMSFGQQLPKTVQRELNDFDNLALEMDLKLTINSK